MRQPAAFNLIFALALAAIPFAAPERASPETTRTFVPSADAYVSSGRPGLNFGVSPFLRIDGKPAPGDLYVGDDVTAASAPSELTTVVSVQGEKFFVNGTVTHPGTPAEGLLLNSRMVQAAFDDENANTVSNWRYPDTGVWDADRNTTEFVNAVPTYAAKGLRAVTINMQGGGPKASQSVSAQEWVATAFNADGSLKQAWLSRLDRAIRAADRNGIVVILGYFYFGQDQRLASESAVLAATDNATDWVLAQGYQNVLIEITNESGSRYDHAILRPTRVGELVNRVKSRSGGKLSVSTSFPGGSIPPDAVIRDSDYVLLHGNGQSASGVASMVDSVRAKAVWRGRPKPIVFNEDSPSVANLDAAVAKRASWGYYEQGANDYVRGFQSPPVNWTINTAAKQAFLDRVAALTSKAPVPPPSSPVGPHELVYSLSSSWASPALLDGKTVSGTVYVFTDRADDHAGITKVEFRLDCTTCTPARTEFVAPYDFKGGSTTANPWNTTTVADGHHTIQARIYHADGVVETQSATFTVDNVADSPPPPPSPSPSGEPMPVGDLPGWKQVFTDDFTQDVPQGQFPAAVSSRWGAYPYPWKGTPTTGTYYPEKTVSWHDGLMDIWIHTENGEHLIAAVQPKPFNGSMYQLYGRYAIRFRTDSFPYYKASWLLWPQSETWPRDGEIDFPEGNFNGTISAFMHRQGGTWGGDQDAYDTNVTFTSWHTAVIEWLPSRCTFILDGRVIGQSTSRIPNTPMRWVIQNGVRFDTPNPDNATQGHVYIDWVAVYRPA